MDPEVCTELLLHVNLISNILAQNHLTLHGAGPRVTSTPPPQAAPPPGVLRPPLQSDAVVVGSVATVLNPLSLLPPLSPSPVHVLLSLFFRKQ